MRDPNRTPVESVADLATLDADEVIEGYLDGRENGPCGDNRSRAYWHGWRNGRVDAGYIERDPAMRRLAEEYCRTHRKAHKMYRAGLLH
jgi:hypothetical protein